MLYVPGYINLGYDEDENLILSSSLHGNKVKLSNKSYIEYFLKNKSKEFNDDNSKFINFLKENAILASKSEIIKNINYLYSIIDKQLIITILPTEKCNFRCTYCYEDFKHGTITKESLEIIHNFIYQEVSTKKYNIVYINWFGGEPTICSDIIVSTNSYIKNICNSFNVQFKSSMTTNGYLLNKQNFLNYYNSHVKVYQITLDGFNHDEKRPTVNGKPTLNQILNNLKEIQALPQEYDYKVYLRYNILKSDTDFSWYDYLKQILKNDQRFILIIREVSDLGGEIVPKQELLSKDNKKLILDQHISYAKSIGLNVESDNNKLLFSRVCYSSRKNSYVFRPNGVITKCTVDLDKNFNQIGLYDKETGVLIDDEKNENWHNSKISEECLTCEMILCCLKKSCYKSNYCYKLRTSL